MSPAIKKTEEIGFFPMMGRVLKFVRPFINLLLLSILLNVLFSIFTAVTISVIKPILEIIFGKSATAAGVVDTSTVSFFGNFKDNFFGIIRKLIDNPHDKYASLINLSYFIIIIFILKNIFKYWGSIVNIKLQEGVVKSIRDRIFGKLTSLSVDYFEQNKEGTIISIISNDVQVVNRTAIMAITDTIREMTQVIILLLWLLAISPYLTFIAFSTSIISLVVLRIAVKYLRRYASRMQTAMADYTSAMQETISGIRVVKAYNAEETANKRFMAQTLRYVVSAVKHRKIIQIIPSANEIFAIAALCVVLFVGGSKVLEGSMNADDLFLFLFSLFAIMSPIASVFNQVSQFQHGYISAKRVFSILDQEPTVKNGTQAVTKFEGAIEVENVDFAYLDVPVIRDATLKVEKNKKVALVGASGSGKSTMLDLIIRFYDPIKGEIKLDGKDIRSFRLEDYRSLFGIVSQETVLFNDTVENNIRFGFDNSTREDIIEAAKMSNAYNFIMNMQNGFDTYVGDRGVVLSGGERQRVAIARALLRNPRILVFDEATSALDAESEKVVQEAIDNSLKNRTAIIVAHRLATIINCDEIIVFDKGKIVERGTHQELLDKNGIYRKLYDIQFAEHNHNGSE